MQYGPAFAGQTDKPGRLGTGWDETLPLSCSQTAFIVGHLFGTWGPTVRATLPVAVL